MRPLEIRVETKPLTLSNGILVVNGGEIRSFKPIAYSPPQCVQLPLLPAKNIAQYSITFQGVVLAMVTDFVSNKERIKRQRKLDRDSKSRWIKRKEELQRRKKR